MSPSPSCAGTGWRTGRRVSWRRVVIEKPFGHDLASARQLEKKLSRAFEPSSIFRIDHYLGKETVQNLLAFRFANTMFEPIWNRNYIDHVQITMAEDIGIAGRAGYYDGIGAARDVIQNHLLQLLALTAMEEPASFDANQLSMEKRKVLAAARVPADLDAHSARGQYSGGWAGGIEVPGYLEEQGIPGDSRTDTYAAIRVDIDNRRWAGVPFYLRAGKRLPRRVTEVALNLRPAPHLPFDGTDVRSLGTNALVLRIQPDEGITLRFGGQGTGHADGTARCEHGLRLRNLVRGNQPRGVRAAAARRPARLGTAVPAAGRGRAGLGDPRPGARPVGREEAPPESYPSGSWGPQSAFDMLARDGFSWRRP